MSKWIGHVIKIVLVVFTIGMSWGASTAAQKADDKEIDNHEKRLDCVEDKISDLELHMSKLVTKDELKQVITEAVKNGLTAWELEAIKDGRLNK